MDTDINLSHETSTPRGSGVRTVHILQVRTVHIPQVRKVHILQVRTVHILQVRTVHILQVRTVHILQLGSYSTHTTGSAGIFNFDFGINLDHICITHPY